MKVLIIEDEAHIAASMKALLKKLRPEAEIVGVTTNISDSRRMIESHPDLDIIFSDIRIDDGLSFTIFESVKTEAMIVFTTAYNEYALKAFDFHCVDYLLKPVTEKTLEVTLLKCESRTARIDNAVIRAITEEILSRNVRYRQRILLHVGRETSIWPVSKISYITTEKGVTSAFLDNGQAGIVNYSITDLAESLPQDIFLRINRQAIVNIGSIAKLSRGDGRENTVTLAEPYSGISFPINQEKKKQLQELLDR